MIRSANQRAATVKKRDEALALAIEGDSAERKVYSDFATRLDDEIREYDALVNGYVRTFRLVDVGDLGDVAIQCRLARGLTQAQLADLVGVAEQQIQRYESGDYSKAALWRIADILDALEFKVDGIIKPKNEIPAGDFTWQPLKPVSPSTVPGVGMSASNAPVHMVAGVSGPT